MRLKAAVFTAVSLCLLIGMAFAIAVLCLSDDELCPRYPRPAFERN